MIVAPFKVLSEDVALNWKFLMLLYFELHLFHAVTYFKLHISHKTSFSLLNHANIIYDTCFSTTTKYFFNGCNFLWPNYRLFRYCTIFNFASNLSGPIIPDKIPNECLKHIHFLSECSCYFLRAKEKNNIFFYY